MVATGKRHWRFLPNHAVTVALATVAVILTLAGCHHKPVMSHTRFINLPVAGWQRTMPLTFIPEYDDSTMNYTLSLAVRHDNAYPYRNLSMIVDIIAEDSTVTRQAINMDLADEYGNWTGGGFGTLYQSRVILMQDASPATASSLVVWQTMDGCDTLRGLVDLGLIASPQMR